MLFAEFVDDSCYNEIPIYKELQGCSLMFIATVASVSSTISISLALCFFYTIFIFEDFTKGGLLIYKYYVYAEKIKKKNQKNGPLAFVYPTVRLNERLYDKKKTTYSPDCRKSAQCHIRDTVISQGIA